MKSIDFTKTLLNYSENKGPLTILYHSIEPGKHVPSWRWAVSLSAFCEQLDLLKDFGFSTVLASDMEKYWELPSKSICITFDDGFADNLYAADALAARNMSATFFIVGSDIGNHSSWLGESTIPKAMLTESDLRQMENIGMEIGSHTMTHKKLTKICEDNVSKELLGAKNKLSSILGRSINVFAYPHGDHNDRVVSLVRKAGYSIAFTTMAGFPTHNHDLVRLPRLNIYNTDTLSWFARKTIFGFEDVSWRYVIPAYLKYRLG